VASDFELIDWATPWFAPWAQAGQAVLARRAAGQSLPEALNAVVDASASATASTPVRFVPQAQLPNGQAYEAFIHASGQVPTREGLHDFFNALCWMHFPLAKRRMNQLQAAEIARAGVGARRGPVRDALTVFDENAMLIQCPDALWQALVAHDWLQAFVSARSLWQDSRVCLFGHAALEKLVRPYKSITAHLWRVEASVSAAELDAWLAQDLHEDKLARKPFSPLPVLGLPGWSPANAQAAFYEDREVFRPRRSAAPAGQKPYADREIGSAA
jgi:hypothetical protein